MNARHRWISIALFVVMSAISAVYVFQIKFSFDFEQFFPQGDPDLEFFREFIEEFETDDNFLLVAVENKEGVFQEDFLKKFHQFTLESRKLPYVTKSLSLTTFSYPLKTPFAITTIPAIHLNKPEKYEKDKKRILSDERFVYNLISPDAKTLLVFLKITDSINLQQSEEQIIALEKMIAPYHFEGFHFLGRSYFTKELVAMQKREVAVSSIVSAFLVLLIMFLIFRRLWGIFVALLSIGVGMLLFFGLLAITGRELSAIAALYLSLIHI